MSLRGSFMRKPAAGGAASSSSSSSTAASSSKKKASRAAPSSTPAAPQLAVRRAVLEDAALCADIYAAASLAQKENVIRAFGQHKIKTLIESCVLCLVVESVSTGAIVGFAAFGDDAPHYLMRVANDNVAADAKARKAAIAAGQPRPGNDRVLGDWSEFLRVNFNTDIPSLVGPSATAPNELTTFNSAWLRYLLLSEDASAGGALDRMLHALFSTLTQVDQVLVGLPVSVDTFAPLTTQGNFEELFVRRDLAANVAPAVITDLKTVRVLACPRAKLLPDLLLRRARIEDNDDLVPICNAQSEILTAIYGEFFLATLIQSQNDHQHALVAEVAQRAVGLASVTDEVDVALLQECFDLDEYEQLRQQKSAEQEAEEAGGPTPLSRMNNIFLCMATGPAPLSPNEREKQAQAIAAFSKRASLANVGSKRASWAGSLAGVQALLKSEPAVAGGAITSATASPVSINTALVGTNVPSALESPSSGALGAPAVVIQVDALTSLPPVWLLNYVETYSPQPLAVAAALAAREAREEAAQYSDAESPRGAEEMDEAAQEEEEALLLDVATVHSSLVTLLANTITLDNRAFNDTVVALMAEMSEASMGGLLRFLELAVGVPTSMPTRPPPVILPPHLDDGTAHANVFCITLFCLDEKYESRSIDVLKAAFDLYPTRNYCVLTLPHTSPPSSINLLNYFTFVRPTARNTFGHALYLLHRDTIATINALQVHTPVLAAVPDYFKGLTAAANAEAEELNAERLIAQVQPLIAHLANYATLRDEIAASVRATLANTKAKAEGTEHMRLKAATTAGLSGEALIAKQEAIRLQLVASKNSPTETLLVSCFGSVVGIVVFNRLTKEEVSMLRADFSVEDFVSLEDLPVVEVPKAHLPSINPFDPAAPLPAPLEDVQTSIHLNILTMVLNPLWNNQVGFICREMLRIKKAHVLYYQVWAKRAGGDKALCDLEDHSGLATSFRFANGFIVPQLVDAFVQVRPRRRPFEINSAQQQKDAELVVVGAAKEEKEALLASAAGGSSSANASSLHVPLPCALHVLSRRLISQPKSVINSRLVIVGSSTTALSFLETLLLLPDKHYSSITLLSKYGLSGGASGAGDSQQGAHFLPWSLAYSEAWLDRLSFGSRIKIVANTLVDLESNSKTLLLADGSSLPYDVLVLTPGLQNQLPLQLIRTITAQALADEIAQKEEARKRHEEAARDARRKKKAQEQGLEDTSGLDAEGLARLDEELDREAAAKASARAARDRGGLDDSFDGSAYSSEDDDLESVASFDSKGKSIRRKRGRKNGAGAFGFSSSPAKPAHDDWKKWVSWSSSGLEHWEAEYGQLLAKQRALAQGTLDPTRALALNAAAREWAASEEGAGESFDPSKLDLTPWGVSGVYSLSSEEHVAALFDAFTKEPSKQRDGKWLVNGASLEALTSIQGLIELGVQPDQITWVHPLSGTSATSPVGPSSIAFLNRPGFDGEDDPLVLQRILSAVYAIGVQILPGKVIKAVKQVQGQVHAVVLADAPITSNGKRDEEKVQLEVDEDSLLELPVVGVIGCGELDVDPYIFRSVHGSSLVYDGRLVLNHAFQTTVPTIYAGGPLAKFSRAYGANVLQLERYNSVEIGQKLCEAVLRTALDVHGAAAAEAAAAKQAAAAGKKAASAKLPALGIQPKITEALLPGELLYFHAAIPTHRTIVKPTVLMTQSETTGRVVRLVFNDANILHAVTVLSSHAAVVDGEEDGGEVTSTLRQATATNMNLVQLIGMPASYMNRILFRFQQKQIGDLVDFLGGSWSSALYHESFSHLRSFLHYFLLSNRLEIVAILDRIIQLFTTAPPQPQTPDPYAEVTAENEVPASAGSVDPFLVSQLTALLPPTMRDTVQRALLRFLRQNANHLPAYTVPPPFKHGPQAKPKRIA